VSDSEKISHARENLSKQLDLMKTVYPKLKELSDTGGKNAVKRYFMDRFGEEPIEQENVMHFGMWILQFDEKERLLSMSSDSGPARAVRDR
jgi:hypothetical protein